MQPARRESPPGYEYGSALYLPNPPIHPTRCTCSPMALKKAQVTRNRLCTNKNRWRQLFTGSFENHCAEGSSACRVRFEVFFSHLTDCPFCVSPLGHWVKPVPVFLFMRKSGTPSLQSSLSEFPVEDTPLGALTGVILGEREGWGIQTTQ